VLAVEAKVAPTILLFTEAVLGMLPALQHWDPDSCCWLPRACCLPAAMLLLMIMMMMVVVSAPLLHSLGAKACRSTPGCST
jgi:hypothetical protein